MNNGYHSCPVVPSTKPVAPEIVRLSIERLKTNASDDILLVCQATGSLPMSFMWLKEGSVIHKETTLVASLVRLKLATDGDGAYTCRAENSGGKDSRNLVVTNENIRVLRQTQKRSAPETGKVNCAIDIFLPFIICILATATDHQKVLQDYLVKYVCIYVCMYVCMYVFMMYVCVLSVYTFVCMYVFMYVCMYL